LRQKKKEFAMLAPISLLGIFMNCVQLLSSMLKLIYIILLTLCSKLTVGQDINLIIQVNDRLEQGTFSNMYVTLDTIINHGKYVVDYVPGNLKLPANLLKKLETDSSKTILLHFTYDTYKKGNHQTAYFSLHWPSLK
jgi:hypothetical protein